MRAAYFSPFNPQKSGISDFSEELIMYLKEYATITIFVSGGNVSSTKIYQEFEVRNIKDYHIGKIRDSFDIAVFHAGNSYQFHNEIIEVFLKYGGVLELHDIAMHHYLAEATVEKGRNDEYMKAMEYCHGLKGKCRAQDFFEGKKAAPWAGESLEYPVNKYLIDKAEAVIVHSDFAYEIVRGINLEVPLIKIAHHSSDIMQCTAEQKNVIREKMDIDTDKLIIGAFGYASPDKRIVQILEALSLYAKKYSDFHFYIVGKVAGIDIGCELKRLGLKDKVTVTGFVDLDSFKYYMLACDVAFNLRYPTQGESSGSLARLLGWGKTVFVTNVGTYREFPDDVVIKIEYGNQEIHQIYDGLLRVQDKLDYYGTNAFTYAMKNISISANAKKYFCFFKDVINHNKIKVSFQDGLLDEIFRFGLDDYDYVQYLCEKMAY